MTIKQNKDGPAFLEFRKGIQQSHVASAGHFVTFYAPVDCRAVVGTRCEEWHPGLDMSYCRILVRCITSQ